MSKFLFSHLLSALLTCFIPAAVAMQAATLAEDAQLIANQRGEVWAKTMSIAIQSLADCPVESAVQGDASKFKEGMQTRLRRCEALTEKSAETGEGLALARKIAQYSELRKELIALATQLRDELQAGTFAVTDLDWCITQITEIIRIANVDKQFKQDTLMFFTQVVGNILGCKLDPALFYAQTELKHLPRENFIPGAGEVDTADRAALYFVACLGWSEESSGGHTQEIMEKLQSSVAFLIWISQELEQKPMAFIRHAWVRNRLLRFLQIVRYCLGDCALETTINPGYPEAAHAMQLEKSSRDQIYVSYPGVLPALRRLADRISKKK